VDDPGAGARVHRACRAPGRAGGGAALGGPAVAQALTGMGGIGKTTAAIEYTDLLVPGTLRTLCDVLILVDQSADPVVSADVVDRGWGAAREGP
jgi:hypothetical protein